MVDFRRRRTFKTGEPLLKVDAGLPVGTYVFRLEVEDENGNRSQPARIKLNIVERRDPITPVRDGGVITPPTVLSGPTVRRP